MKRKTFLITLILFLTALYFSSVFLYFSKFQKEEYRKIGSFPLPWEEPIWERKVKTDQILKIGLITDTHVHASRINKEDDLGELFLRDKYQAPLDAFVKQMKIFQPQSVVHLGDVIEGTGEEDYVGLWGLKLVKQTFDQIETENFWLVGNHDLRSVSKEQFRDFFDLSSLDQVVDKGDYRLIFLDANYAPDGSAITPTSRRHIPGYLSPETLIWLEDQLKTDKNVYIFVHQAPFERFSSEGKLKSNFSITNALRLRKLAEQYQVEAIFNGHVEVKNFEEKKGVKYYSLVGTQKSEEYPGAFFELTIKGNNPKVTLYYSRAGQYHSASFEP